ncbi:Sodium/hydrogen exchanger [Aspergillus steynii IBT 23096]|uniref:Sodium/hydrogen exchanger n=1 Tax=Aspergillus steynii IBT 23096 TaxID=1392250 RepID=A0A2I2GD40_9EURO|nr:Sodium/hydrogen exchanger [Aspergillus steynii IBT 23096]PLB50782.1 Sodium/hydrogen exchanger [Aspergillus steynii IBT 23096]
MADQSEAAFAYHEPAIATVLNLAGFLLVLNLVNVCLDKLLYCGLIGQLFIGILWGTPGAKWLDRGMETAVQQLGYLGLIMLVYEGGLSTSIKSLKANLLLSLSVAITGISVPMGLSFILMDLVSATPLQAFAAGAALSATSLGTTFTILSTTNLITTRLGVVTTSAAMIDDVVGLIMVQIISNLGGSDSFSVVTVIRPIFVSIGFAVGLFLACRFCLQPVLRKLVGLKDKMPGVVLTAQFAFVAHTCVLVGLVAGATYAGTSSLFAAYLAGVIVSWFDGIVAEKEQAVPSQQSGATESSNTPETSDNGKQPTREPTPLSSPVEHPPAAERHETPTGVVVYERYYKEPVNRVFIPLFFASIGFAIPITEMFQGSIVWRGVVYALLMVIAKFITGLWLVRVSLSPVYSLLRTATKPFSYATLVCFGARKPAPRQKQTTGTEIPMKERTPQPQTSDTDEGPSPSTNPDTQPDQPPQAEPSDHPAPSAVPQRTPSNRVSLPPKPKSLYPSSLLGLAMVARGEIGYLIASLAESRGIFSDGASTGTTESYLVIVWAITLCTLIGPICVGTLVRRVKTLQQKRVRSGGMDPLGVWGI